MVAPAPVLKETGPGAVMVGGIAGSSVTATLCVPVVINPEEFVAVYVMIVVPVGKTKLSHVWFGFCGVGQAICGIPVRLIDTADPQSGSEAVATPNSSSRVAVQELVVADTLGGTFRIGGVVSVPVTVTVCVHETVWPSVSLAVQTIVVVPTG
jgi:hypothetical protein